MSNIQIIFIFPACFPVPFIRKALTFNCRPFLRRSNGRPGHEPMRLRAEGVSVLLPPPNGAQMTRRMALTQSSMSVWELAISRKDSWLSGARSFSPVPPGGDDEERSDKHISQNTGLLHTHHIYSYIS